jgi:hypothetical protein
MDCGRSTVFAGLLCLGLAACAGKPAPQAAMDAPLVLDAQVQQKLGTILKDYRPTASLVGMSMTRDIDNKGNFGRIVHYESHASYARQDNGLWEVAGGGGFVNGTASGSGDSLVLCGLVILINASGSTSALAAMGVAPAGKVFVPFGIRTTANFDLRQRVTKLETAAPLCAPVPGTTFSYHVETEVYLRTNGMLGQTRHITGAADVTCTAAPAPTPARDIAAAFRGDALRVSCLRGATGGAHQKVEYAFLRDVGFYIILSEGEPSDVQYTVLHYNTAQYGS